MMSLRNTTPPTDASGVVLKTSLVPSRIRIERGRRLTAQVGHRLRVVCRPTHGAPASSGDIHGACARGTDCSFDPQAFGYGDSCGLNRATRCETGRATTHRARARRPGS